MLRHLIHFDNVVIILTLRPPLYPFEHPRASRTIANKPLNTGIKPPSHHGVDEENVEVV